MVALDDQFDFDFSDIEEDNDTDVNYNVFNDPTMCVGCAE
jgi:hypothetical protein